MIRTALALALSGLALTSVAQAQDAVAGSEWSGVREYTPSDERFTAEVGMGAYRPSLGRAFEDSFGGDLGPLLHLELDVHLFRIPYIGPLAIGGAFGWVEWNGAATAVSGSATNVGDTGMSLIPLSLLAILRIDGLARELAIPFVVSVKFGGDFGYYQTGTAGSLDADGWSVGLHWAIQAALELDFLEQRAANRLDQEWGINHSLVYFELFGSTMGQMGGNSLPMGTDLAWQAGLQLTF